MKATDLLKMQHREVDDLFEQIEHADTDEKTSLREELVTNLVAHSVIEKELFYKAAMRAMSDKDILLEAYEEHRVVEFCLQNLLNTDVRDESFGARVTVLKELVQHHVKEEEKELFKKVEKAIDQNRLEQLGMNMEVRFEEARTEGYERHLGMTSSRSRSTNQRTMRAQSNGARQVGSSRVDLQACKLEYSIVSPK